MTNRRARYGLSEADIERVIGELIQDDKITSAIEKIVNRRLRRNPHGSKEWKQAVVDRTVQEVLQKLRIVDMILEEHAGYEYRPAFSETEPLRQQAQNPRRRVRQINREKSQPQPDWREQPAAHAEGSVPPLDLDSTQVLMVTLPHAIKNMTSPAGNGRSHSFDSSGGYDEASPLASFQGRAAGSDEEEIFDIMHKGSDDDEDIAEPELCLQSAEQNMQNDSVEYDCHSGSSFRDSTDESARQSRSPGSGPLEAAEQEQHPGDSLEVDSPRRGSGRGTTGDIVELPTEDDIIFLPPELPVEGSAAADQSAESEGPEYADEEFEEGPSESTSNRKVTFIEPLVSDVYLTRYKYDREEVSNMFYTAEEGTKFQMDFDREVERSMNADKGWLEWMMERSDEDALHHEQEDETYEYDYELEGADHDDDQGDYF